MIIYELRAGLENFFTHVCIHGKPEVFGERAWPEAMKNYLFAADRTYSTPFFIFQRCSLAPTANPFLMSLHVWILALPGTFWCPRVLTILDVQQPTSFLGCPLSSSSNPCTSDRRTKREYAIFCVIPCQIVLPSNASDWYFLNILNNRVMKDPPQFCHIPFLA